MIPLSTQLESKRLILRRPQGSDIPHIFSATRFEGFNDGILWNPPQNIEDLETPYHNAVKAWENQDGFAFTIASKEDAFIGRISIRKTKIPKVWNIGFWTHPTQQGKGYITEAISAILAFGFEQLKATSIEADYATWNIGSEKVLQRNGFTFLKHHEKGFCKNGEWVAENVVGINKTEWELQI